MSDNDEWQEPVETAEHIKIPLKTLYAWRHRGVGPPSHKIGRHVRYSKKEVEEWARAQ